MNKMNLHPLLLMSKEEIRTAKKLLLGRDKIVLKADNTWQHIAKKDALKKQLNDLAEAVLAREIGLKQFMLIKVECDDRPVQSILLERLVLDDGWDWRQDKYWGWYLSGGNIRQDGSMGNKTDYCIIGSQPAIITRRRLDGSWQELKHRTEKTCV